MLKNPKKEKQKGPRQTSREICRSQERRRWTGSLTEKYPRKLQKKEGYSHKEKVGVKKQPK